MEYSAAPFESYPMFKNTSYVHLAVSLVIILIATIVIQILKILIAISEPVNYELVSITLVKPTSSIALYASILTLAPSYLHLYKGFNNKGIL